MSKRSGSFVVILVCLLLAACQSAGPVKSFVKGDEIVYYDFTSPNQFEQGTYDNAALLVRDGAYRIDVRTGDNELWWGQGGPTLSDVVIDVDATQLSERNENAFGVMCRVRGHVGQTVRTPPGATATGPVSATEAATAAATAVGIATEAATAQMMSGATAEATLEATAEETAIIAGNPLAQELAEVTPALGDAATAEATAQTATRLEDNQGDGYLFLIQGSGSFGIFRARGRSLTPLVNWTTSDKIKLGPDSNHLRAVCVGSYLAFYANDAFLGDATDDQYKDGQVGLAASAANRLGLQVTFDNLSIAAAKPG